MEVKKIAENEVKSLLMKLFSDELQGCETTTLSVKMLYNITARDYTPAYVLEAKSAKEKKFLIYSPLQMLVNVCDELTFEEVGHIGNVYHQGCLNAYINHEDKDMAICLFLDECEGSLCKDREKALSLIKAKVAMLPFLQVDFFKFPLQEIYPCKIENVLYWLMPHKGNCCFLVNVSNSEVSYVDVKPEYITFIHEEGEIKCNTKENAYYMYDGKSFSVPTL